MATGFSPTPRKEGTWTKLVIFVSLYCLILESIVGLVLVFYLYGNHLVDSKMTLSLILCMVAVRIHTSTDLNPFTNLSDSRFLLFRWSLSRAWSPGSITRLEDLESRKPSYTISAPTFSDWILCYGSPRVSQV